jgi:hypothetical protein
MLTSVSCVCHCVAAAYARADAERSSLRQRKRKTQRGIFLAANHDLSRALTQCLVNDDRRI